MSVLATIKGFQLGKKGVALLSQVVSNGFSLSKGKQGFSFTQRGSNPIQGLSQKTGINSQYLTYGAVALGLYLLMKR